MSKVALIGAGGKMGYRLAANFRGSSYEVRHVEVSEMGRQRLKDGLGLDAVPIEKALDGADVVVLAVPDTHIGKVAAGIEKQLKPGTMVIVLDAAAPAAGHLPKRPDLTYFITHPCHPPTLQRRDGHGGEEGLFRRRQSQAAHRQRPDAGPGERTTPRARRSPRRSGLR